MGRVNALPSSSMASRSNWQPFCSTSSGSTRAIIAGCSPARSTQPARAISLRFRLALGWLAIGTLLGAVLPALGMAVIAAFITFYWLPIRGEIAKANRRRDRKKAREATG
jgi:hypothetical protein